MQLVPSRLAIENRIGELCWLTEGTGFTFTRRDILDMTVAEMDEMIALGRRRKRELAQAIRNAHKTKPQKGRRR